ncbi:hypothetical protein PWT90_08645 [Aphanocladium album]|nr:hypothetical protein PWT90_08645 [Aphanocladium album]
MKFTAATIAAVLASGVLAKPSFTNSEVNPKEGKPFTLTFNGCDTGCTITLQTGPNSQALSDIRTLTTDAKGGSYDVTLDNIGSGSYNFKITSNSDPSDPNYSTTFSYTGTGPTSFGSSSSASPTTSGSSSASTDSTSTGSSSTSSTSGSSSTSSATSSSDSSSTTDSSSTDSSSTSSASSTHSSRSSATTSSKATSTTPPGSGAVANLSPIGLVGAAAAALLL